MYEEIRKQAENVANEICDAGKLKKGQILDSKFVHQVKFVEIK